MYLSATQKKNLVGRLKTERAREKIRDGRLRGGRKTQWKKGRDKPVGTGTLTRVLDKGFQLVTNFPGFAQSSF